MPIIRKQLIGTAAALLFMLTAATPILGWSQTETKQSTNTIYEKRIYAVKVGEMVETKRLFTTIGWPALVEGKFDKNVVGYFISDTGDLHQLIIILRFDSDQDRRDFWKRLYANEKFMIFVKQFRSLLLSQNVQLMVPAPWGPQP
ncbi:NIPSNAP [Oxalobacteraceae bacterium]